MGEGSEALDRRAFVGRLALTGAAGVLGLAAPAVGEPPPETKRLRLLHRPSLCDAPQFFAEELLQGEGFTEVTYVKFDDFKATEAALTSGDADITMEFALSMIPRIDTGEPIVFLAGVHVGCTEVFANQRLRTIRDLKGKRFAVSQLRTGEHFFIGSIGAHVGLRPELLASGKIDGFMGFPPLAQETRAKRIGHVILNTLTDRPWSQYFCCMIAGNREFVRRNPVATKRAVRAILKASEICAIQPERVARFLVDKGYVERSDYSVQSMKELVYGKWREYDPNDAVRFYSLRLHEAGMIKSTPQKILAQGTDWRFLNELKKELKG